MKQFDSHRFATLVKWHLVGNRREILNVFLGLAIGYFAVLMFFTQVARMSVVNADEEWVYASFVHQSMGAGLFCVLMTAFVGAARIFSNMKATRQRTTFLMLPASSLEKWLLRLLHATVLTVVLALAALVVADTVRMLIAPLWGKPLVSGMTWLLTDNDAAIRPSNEEGLGLMLACAAGMLLIVHSAYVLGGTLFRKQPFVISSFCIFAGWMLLMYVLQWTGFLEATNRLTWLSHENGHLHVNPLIYAYLAVNYALVALFYWLSYRIFTRMQVINNKWLNV